MQSRKRGLWITSEYYSAVQPGDKKEHGDELGPKRPSQYHGTSSTNILRTLLDRVPLLRSKALHDRKVVKGHPRGAARAKRPGREGRLCAFQSRGLTQFGENPEGRRVRKPLKPKGRSAKTRARTFPVPGKSGGLNGSTQHQLETSL